MNIKHVTLATAGAVLTVAGTGYGLYSTIRKDIQDSRDAQVQKALTYERRYEYLNGRLDQLEMAVRALASAQPKQERLLEQILAVKRQAVTTLPTQIDYSRSAPVLMERKVAEVPLPAKPTTEKPQ